MPPSHVHSARRWRLRGRHALENNAGAEKNISNREANAMDPKFTAEFQRSTIVRVSWRLLPLIVVSYLVAYIDRTNVAFAALTMNKDLGISSYMYGWGAGIFFIGYALFEVPSNMILERVGARRWIARILITWGIISGLMAAPTGPASFLR